MGAKTRIPILTNVPQLRSRHEHLCYCIQCIPSVGATTKALNDLSGRDVGFACTVQLVAIVQLLPGLSSSPAVFLLFPTRLAAFSGATVVDRLRMRRLTVYGGRSGAEARRWYRATAVFCSHETLPDKNTCNSMELEKPSSPSYGKDRVHKAGHPSGAAQEDNEACG